MFDQFHDRDILMLKRAFPSGIKWTRSEACQMLGFKWSDRRVLAAVQNFRKHHLRYSFTIETQIGPNGYHVFREQRAK